MLTGCIDIPAYDRLVANQIAAGVEGIIVGGTTGEGHIMDWDEHLLLIAHTVNTVGTKVQGESGA